MTIFIGDDGDDVLVGGDCNDVLVGGGGGDTIYGGNGGTIYGGPGNDTIYVTSRNTTVFGGDGDDVLIYVDFYSEGDADLVMAERIELPDGDDYFAPTSTAPSWDSAADCSDLDGTTGFRLDGLVAEILSGWAVLDVGDCNADGFGDFAVCANLADRNPTNSGATYVVFGKASGFAATIDLSSLDGTTGFRLEGVADDDESGYSVASAGDVNHDGFDDLIIGAPGVDSNGGDNGATYVVFGKATGWAATTILSSLDGTTGFRLDGAAAFDGSGNSVSGAGDVNDDGFADLIVGAVTADPNGAQSGASYVVFGKASGWTATVALSSLDGTTEFRLDGVAANHGSGHSVSDAGDVNVDGFADLIVGANSASPNGSSSGSSYVVFGKASGWAATNNLASLDGTTGFRLDGEGAADNSGSSVSAAGDVDADGFDDLIVGSHLADPNGLNNSGSTYVVFGKASGWAATTSLASLDGSTGFRLDGAAANDFSGQSVSAAGDVNADGFDDLIVGAYLADPHGTSSGSSYVIFGHARGTPAYAVDGGAGNDTITGEGAADTLRGEGDSDTLDGAGGDDTLGGGSGDDSLTGGLGNDVADYGSLAAAIVATLDGAGTLTLTIEGTDRLAGIEGLIGGSGDDIVTGDGLANRLYGGLGGDRLDGAGGDDTLHGGAGLDSLIGGSGNDTAWYDAETAVVYADLGTGGGHVGGTLVDHLAGIENLASGSANDVLVGDGNANALSGGAGSDLLFGMDGDDLLTGCGASFGSANQLFGGNGNDTASYAAETSRVYATIEGAAGYVGGLIGAGLRDSFAAIENLRGGAGNDLLVGDATINTLHGGAGSDVLFGRNGDDVLIGGAVASGGYNQLFGGTGNDTASYAGETTAVTASLAGRWAYVGGVAATNLRDVFNGVENLVGGSAVDVLVGDGLANILEGGGGADQLYGGADADTFVFRAVSDSNVVTGYDTIVDFVAGTDRIDLRALGTNSGRVIITSDGTATKLLVELSPGTFDGVFDGSSDLAVAFIGGNALTVADILF